MEAHIHNPPGLPSPPFHEVEGLPNLRDVGGYPLPSSRSVRPGLLFRAADPSRITPQGLSQLSSLNIRTVYDFRSTPEIKRQGVEWAGETPVSSPFDGTGITRHWTPVFRDTDYTPEALAVRFGNYAKGAFAAAYDEILVNGKEAYAVVLRHLATAGEGGTMVHCTAGKDRTGVVVALVLLLLGVEEEVVAREYALTDLGLAELKPIYRERLLEMPALKGNEEGVERMISARKENMIETMQLLREKYGGAEGYVRDVLGLKTEEIEQLRRNLSCDKPATL